MVTVNDFDGVTDSRHPGSPSAASPTPAIAFVGRSGSGKTTLIEKVVTALVGRGLVVGTIKHHSHTGFEIDHEGKDSWRHRQAGSSHAVIASPDRIASIRSLDHELEFDQIIATMNGLDVIVVEGYRQAGLPTMELFRADNPRDAEAEIDVSSEQIIGVVTDMARIESVARQHDLACFGFDDVDFLADFISDHII